MRIPSPQECGLPEKFSSWRPQQEDALDFLLYQAKKRIKVICAPTGFGKSPVVVAFAKLSKEPTAIVTENRALQDQYVDDFGSVGMVNLRGRNNYICDLRPDYTCEDGYQARCPYKGTIGCPASQAEMRAAISPLVILNYAKWTAARKFGQGVNHFTQVVFDEGDLAPDALAKAMQVTLSFKEMDEAIGIDPPADTTSLLLWKLWASGARAIIEDKFKAATERLRESSNTPQSWIRHTLHMRYLGRRLAILSTCRPADWVVEELEKGWVFDPVRPSRYAEAALLLRIPNVVILSATIRPKTLYMLGQGADTFDFREFDSDFDPARCPIYWVPTMRADYKSADWGAIWLKLDQIAARRRDRKGIVQTVSFARRDQVKEVSRFSESMLVNTRGEAATEAVDLFKASPAGTILVSPSVGRGFDFAGPACEWQFLCNIPFLPPSAILKARTEDDKEYPYYAAWQTMVQIFGRGMRYRQDQCEGFLTDDRIEWFLPKWGHLAPRSFHRFFKRVDRLPQPPPPLR